MKKNIRSLYAAILVLLLVPSMAFPQLQKAGRTTRLDPRLQQIVDQARKRPALQKLDAQSLQSVTSAEGKQQFPCFVHSDDMQRLRSDGIPLQTVIGTFATARLTVEELEMLSTHTAVQYVEPTTVEYPHNDVAAAMSGADVLHSGNVNSTQYTGSGVIVGIIDTGIDWDHLDFRDPATPAQSRILYIWDQTLIKTGAEVTPVSYSYGVQYSNAQIEDELDGSPAGFVRESDINGHGTHVAGTAAGNGSSLSTKKYKGIAPEADIIVVKAGDGSFPSTNIVDGISYMDSVAAVLGKPLVINMSLGSDQGPHDGKDSKGLAVESFSGPGRIAVMSAGNSGALPIHFTGSVGALDSSTVTLTVPAYTPAGGASNDYFQFDVWLDNSTAVTAKVVSPGGHTATQVSNSAAVTQTDDGTIYLYNAINGNNGDRNILSQVYDANASVTPAQGTWTLRLINTTGSAVTYHGWLYDYTIGTGNSTVTVTGGSNNYTVSNCSDSAIIVGSYASRWSWTSSNGSSYAGGGTDYSDDISSFSSIGPSRTGGQKPDIAAPGQHIVSSLSTDASFDATEIVTDGLHAKSQGTSMSSPVVAGAVALLLQQNASYSTLQAKSLLTSTAMSDAYTGGSLPDAYWGYGKLDILHAMVKAIDGSFVFARSIPAYDEWGSINGYGFGAGVKVATKFTSPIAGKITGALFYPSTLVNLTGPLSVEIWSDNAGLPNVKLGSTTSADQNALLKYSWNAMDMTGSGVSVSSSTNYHLVLYFTSGTSFSIAYDDGSVDNRSSINTGISWAAYPTGDFHLRPVIMTDISLLPVELVAFSGTATEHGVELLWNTASEVNSYGFEVERRLLRHPEQVSEANASKDASTSSPNSGGFAQHDWTRVGFVEGNGTSNSPHAYSFADKNVKPGRFSYRLKMIDRDGKFSYSNEIEVSFGRLPKNFSLEQNFPNPFNPTTEVRYQISEAGHVTLKIFDALGREAAAVVNEMKEPGSYSVKFNASHLSSGMYFARLQCNGKQLLRKMLLMK